MANPSNNLDRKDNNALWAVMIVIALAVVAYAGYTTYYGNRYQTIEGTTPTIINE